MFNRYFWDDWFWDDDDDYYYGYGFGWFVVFAVELAIAIVLAWSYGIYGIFGLVTWILDKNKKEVKPSRIEWVFSLRALHSKGMSVKDVLIFDGALIAQLPATGIRYLYRFLKKQITDGNADQQAVIEETH